MELSRILNEDTTQPPGASPVESSDPFTIVKLPYPVNRLYLSDVQQKGVNEVYQKEQTYSEVFNATNQDQGKALKLLEPKLLWIKIWSSKWSTRDGEKQHTLYQCRFGYDAHARRRIRSPAEGDRQARYDEKSAGCIAHMSVQKNLETNQIFKLKGYLEHSPQCAELQRSLKALETKP